jgi:hypothetical protein
LMRMCLEKSYLTVLNMRDISFKIKILIKELCCLKLSKPATMHLTSYTSSLQELTKSDAGLFVNLPKHPKPQEPSILISRKGLSVRRWCVMKIWWVWAISRLLRLKVSTFRRAKTTWYRMVTSYFSDST